VNKLLDSAAPGVDFTRRKYVEAHDAIVASAAYTHALEAAAHLLHKARPIVLAACSALVLKRRSWEPDMTPAALGSKHVWSRRSGYVCRGLHVASKRRSVKLVVSSVLGEPDSRAYVS
jgi:hypothetical protein